MTEKRGFQLEGNELSLEGIQAWIQSEEKYHDALNPQEGEDSSYSTSYWKYIWYLEQAGLNELLASTTMVLDFGCADGKTLTHFKGSFEYFGVDISANLLERAKLFWPKGILQKLSKHDQVPFPENKFDGVICLGVLHHVPNVSAVLKELSRVLKPNGWILQLDPITDMTRLDGTRRDLSPKERGIPPVFFQQEAPKLGLKIERVLLGGLGGLNQAQALCKSYYFQKAIFVLDQFICRFFSPLAIKYKRTKFLEKIAPTFAVHIFRKS